MSDGRLAQCFEITRQAQCFKIRRQAQHFKIFRQMQFSDFRNVASGGRLTGVWRNVLKSHVRRNTYPQLVQSQWAVDQRHLAIIAANIHGYFSQKSEQINSQKHLITLKCIVHL